MNETKWYALQVYSGSENKVIDTIKELAEKKGFDSLIEEILSPNVNLPENVSEKEKKNLSKKKLLIGYILIRMNINESLYHMIMTIPRVSGFLGGLNAQGMPFNIREEDVSSFIQGAEEHSSQSDISANFQIGEQVKITSEPFVDFKGVIEDIDYQKNKIKVSMSIFGRLTIVDLEAHQLEKIND